MRDSIIDGYKLTPIIKSTNKKGISEQAQQLLLPDSKVFSEIMDLQALIMNQADFSSNAVTTR
jgi:hypothetical protein